jgi:dynein regulatory complex protein 1
MNEKEVQELKDKIIKCDKVIHNQQLGLDWLALNTPEEEHPEEKPLVIENEEEEEQETQLAVSEEKAVNSQALAVELQAPPWRRRRPGDPVGASQVHSAAFPARS